MDYVARYEVHQRWEHDYISKMDSAMRKGRAEGKIEDRNERTTEIAKNLKYAGLPLKTISENTGLSEKVIAEL